MNPYARPAMDPTQDAPLPLDPALAAPLAEERERRMQTAAGLGALARRGLVRWTVLTVLAGALAIFLQHPDVALFLAGAAMFALAQSWDARDGGRTGHPDSDWMLDPGPFGTLLRVLVPLAIPLAAVLLYIGIAMFARNQAFLHGHRAALQWSVASAVVCAALAVPAASRQITRAFVPEQSPGYTARLAGAIAVAVLLLPVPFQLLSAELGDLLQPQGKSLVSAGTLAGQLAGEVVLAFAAIGLWVRRDARAAVSRLGLGGLGIRHLVIAAIGLAVVAGGNAGMEWAEERWFHALWVSDQAMTKLIAGNLSAPGAVLLGISAGIGEELLVRGALQPRFGIFWSTVLFACGHVQYSWFGMLTVAFLGVTLGLIRRRANTTTCIIVHLLYDVVAALGAR
jgi:membrane protease YdiL (CAAX protease family)